MVRINLIPKEERVKRVKKRVPTRRKVAIPAGIDVYAGIGFVIIVLIIAIVGHARLTRKITDLNNKIAAAKEELKKLKKEVQLVNNLTKEREKLMVLVDMVKELNKERALRFYFLQEMLRILPEYVWLTSLNEKERSVSLSGITFSNLIVADFMERMMKSPYFQDVELIELKKTEIEGHEVTNFTITAKLVFPGIRKEEHDGKT
ncbi:hypothetical protein DRQ18_08085 [bacterium]|nr:MAG: hypothetical protein DRQ18_08085 [bacterium]